MAEAGEEKRTNDIKASAAQSISTSRLNPERKPSSKSMAWKNDKPKNPQEATFAVNTKESSYSQASNTTTILSRDSN